MAKGQGVEREKEGLDQEARGINTWRHMVLVYHQLRMLCFFLNEQNVLVG